MSPRRVGGELDASMGKENPSRGVIQGREERLWTACQAALRGRAHAPEGIKCGIGLQGEPLSYHNQPASIGNGHLPTLIPPQTLYPLKLYKNMPCQLIFRF